MSNGELNNQPAVFVAMTTQQYGTHIGSLLRSVGMEAHLLGLTEEFMQTVLPQCPCCLVLDVRLPGINGIDFKLTLQNAGIDIPIIFITGHGDIRMTVQAMRAGAIESLTKPFRNQDLLDAVRFVIEKMRAIATWTNC